MNRRSDMEDYPQLESLTHNLYVNVSDEMYDEKKLRYLGNDFESLMRVAERRVQEGQWNKALDLYRRAEKSARYATQQSRAEYCQKRLAQQMKQMWFAKQPATHASGKNSRVSWLAWLLLGVIIGLWMAVWMVQIQGGHDFLNKTGPPGTHQTPGAHQPPGPGADPDSQGMAEDHPPSITDHPKPWRHQVQLLDFQLTYLRTALHNYYLQEGNLPRQLTMLDIAYPDNYISLIPEDPWLHSSKVVDQWDGSGGWVYQPPSVFSQEPPLEDILTPNLPFHLLDQWEQSGHQQDFQTLSMEVSLEDREISLKSGEKVWLKAPVAYGKHSSPTPTGDFLIQQRVWQPQMAAGSPKKAYSPYGIAGLAFAGDYAIHGTNVPASIGFPATLGCLRLDDKVMEAFYFWTPLGTPLHIVENRTPNHREPPVEAKMAPEMVMSSVVKSWTEKEKEEEMNGLHGYAWRM